MKSRRTMQPRWLRGLLAASLALFLVGLGERESARAQDSPWSIEALLTGLEKAKGNETFLNTIAKTVQVRGVDFRLTPENELTLRRAGANDALIEAIRRNCRGAACTPKSKPLIPTPTPKPVTPLAQDRRENSGKFSAADLGDREVELFFLSFKTAIAKDDKEKIASMIAVPIKVKLVTGPLVTLKNRAEFIAAYDMVFDKEFKKVILQTQVEDLWANSRGVAMPRGEIWITGVQEDKRDLEKVQIKIFSINNIFSRSVPANRGKR